MAENTPNWKFYIGHSTEVNTVDINTLREQVEEIRNLADETGTDLSKHLSDFCFSVEADYQAYHGLDENCWDIVHTK